MRTQILVTIDHTKPIPDLIDLVAGRAWTIDGVHIAEASKVNAFSASEMIDLHLGIQGRWVKVPEDTTIDFQLPILLIPKEKEPEHCDFDDSDSVFTMLDSKWVEKA